MGRGHENQNTSGEGSSLNRGETLHHPKGEKEARMRGASSRKVEGLATSGKLYSVKELDKQGMQRE